jgi:hypothetical protein
MSKPKPPEVNEENLRKVKSQEGPLKILKNIFENLEVMRKTEELPSNYINLEGIYAIFISLSYGFSPEEIKATYPKEWGVGGFAGYGSEITLPTALLVSLCNDWVKYHKPDCKNSFGEVLGIEGGGQGKSSAKKKLKTIIYHRNLAYRVEAQYYKRTETETISLKKIIKNIADQDGITTDTVEKAHRKYHKPFREELLDLEIIQ